MSLKDKLIKNSTIKITSSLDESKFFLEKNFYPTQVPMLNVAQSARLNGGGSSGLTLWCGPSKHFKTLFMLLNMKAYLDTYDDAFALLYDSEFGAPFAYFDAIGIDKSRVIHTPITDIEQLKFDLANQLKNIERNDHVFIGIDSVGNLASRKEVEDAENEKSVADMTRAKQLKSLFRIVTPHLTIKDIPMHVVNHIYMEIGMFPKAIVSGGTGIYLSADNIFIIGRQQEKDGSDISGYHFVINVEKSRHVREKSKIPITVLHNGGMNVWSGLLDVAMDGGFVAKPKIGWYCKVNQETGEHEDKNYRAKDTNTKDFWLPIITSKEFKDYIESRYAVSSSSLIQEDVEEQED